MRVHLCLLAFLTAATLPCFQSPAEGPIRLKGHEGGISSLSFSPDGKVLVSTEPDSVKVWDLETKKPILSYNSGTGGAYLLSAFSPDGALLAVHALEGTRIPQGGKQVVILWDTANWEKKKTIELPHRQNQCHDLQFTPDGKRLVWGTWDGEPGQPSHGYRYFVSDVQSGEIVAQLRMNERSSGRPFVLTQDGKRLIHGQLTYELRDTGFQHISSDILVWEIGESTESTRRAQVPGGIFDMKISPDGQRLAVAGGGDYNGRVPGMLLIYDLDNASADPLSLEGPRGTVHSVAFAPGGHILASGGIDKSIRLWNAHTGKLLREFRDHTTRVSNVAISPDGKWLASGAGESDATIRLWPLSGDLIDPPAKDR